jgi:hypothetical protein
MSKKGKINTFKPFPPSPKLPASPDKGVEWKESRERSHALKYYLSQLAHPLSETPQRNK